MVLYNRSPLTTMHRTIPLTKRGRAIYTRSRSLYQPLLRTHAKSTELSGCCQGTRNLTQGSTAQQNMSDTSEKTGAAAGEDLMKKAWDVLFEDAFVKGLRRTTKIVDYKSPHQLKECMDFSIKDSSLSEAEVLEILRQTAKYGVQTGHPRYFNQLYQGRDVPGLTASLIVEALNSNVHTYESAPVFTIAEMEVLKAVCQRIGYEDGDGIFMSGGSLCNMVAFNMARYNHDKKLKRQGMYRSPKLVIFSTADAHYSVKKGCSFLGFGTDSIVTVAEDDRGRMVPQELEKEIKLALERGDVPLCVMATCGSTVLGSFDPLEPLADISEAYGCWLHVDACWGGGALFSDNHRHLLSGLERSDSVSISFHKLMAAQIQCAAVLSKRKGFLKECNATDASYLFQTDKTYYDPSYDLGQLTIQCGRKADGFNFWLLWKARGHLGMQSIVDKVFANAKYFTEKLKKTEGIKLVLPEFEYVNISFWYIPPSMRGQPETEEWWSKLAKVAPRIKERMMQTGTLAVAYQPLESQGFVNFFRIIIGNPDTTTEDLDFVLDEIHSLGKDL